MTAIERTRRGTPPLVLLLVLVIAACSEGTTTQPPAVSVTVSPATTTIGAGDTGSFTATVANATNDAVTWSASAGTLAGTGPNAVEWTAPVSGGTATITATSMEDPSASASAAVTVTPVVVAVTPQTSAFFRGEERTFTASVTGTSTTAVSWDATCGTGTATGNTFAYVAPTTAGTSCTITATSDLDPMADAVVTGSVRQAWLVTSGDDVADGSCTWARC